MKKHIYFNLPDKPSNMGQSQMVEPDGLIDFISERKDLLPNAKIESDRITFDVVDGDTTRRGYALIIDVPNDFQN